jgi:hypothetical protein
MEGCGALRDCRYLLRSRHQVHPVVPGDHCIRPGRTVRAACLQPEPECLCGALGQVGEGGVPGQGDPLWRALAAASAGRICRTFPCRTESPREGQCPAVPSECKHPPRRACSMPRATGRPVTLLPSGGSVTTCHQMSAQTETKKRKTMRINEAGWLISVNAWLRLECPYLKLRLFLRV